MTLTDHDELTGHWSVDHGYHSAMEDEWLMFRGDGSGWYAYLRPWYSCLRQFTWTRLGPNRIRVHVHSEIDLDESPDQLDRRELDEVQDATYTLDWTQRPLLQHAVPELRIDLRRWLRSPLVLVEREEPLRDFLRKAGIQE